MKKQGIFLLTLLTFSLSVYAQKEYRIAKASGRLNLNLNGAIVEGYNGNEIIFSSQKPESEVVDERARGLSAISGSGLTDNSGLGINVTQNGQEIDVNIVGRRAHNILYIKVPQNIKVSFSNAKNLQSDEVILKNLKSELEVSTMYNKVKLENNTGPMNIKTIYGSVDASFTSDIKGPVSIISVYNYVDVSLPASVKANVELSTAYGSLYAAKEFNIVPSVNKEEKRAVRSPGNSSLTEITVEGSGVRQNNEQNWDSGSSSHGTEIITLSAFRNNIAGEYLKGTINNGGAELIFKSNYKNVYLRQN